VSVRDSRSLTRNPHSWCGALIAVALASVPLPASAQDTHYWNLQYGPVAELLGGTVVGSADDLSSTYYNPGGLALAEDPAFLLSLNSFQLEQVSITDQQEIFDLSSSRFGAAPALIAGVLPGGGEKTRLAWSFLTRQEFKVRIQSRAVAQVPGPPELRAGAEDLTDQSESEFWGGLTISRRLSDHVAVGGTLYGVYRKQRIRNEINGQAATSAGDGLSFLAVNDFDYDHTRILGKLGVALDFESLSLGLVVTTPSAGLFGSGKGGFTRSSNGIDLDGDGVADESYLDNAFAEGLESNYRSPLSISFGAAYRVPRGRFHFSAEWFDRIDRFDVLDPTPFLEASNGSFAASLRQQLDSVLNVGFGYERRLTSDLKIYGAFATDFTANVRDPEIRNTISTWDIYHFTTGAAFGIGDTRFTLGVGYSFGGDKVRLGILDPEVELPLIGAQRDADVSYRRWKFILGFEFGS